MMADITYSCGSISRRTSSHPVATEPTEEQIQHWVAIIRTGHDWTHRAARRFCERFALDLACNLNGRPEAGIGLWTANRAYRIALAREGKYPDTTYAIVEDRGVRRIEARYGPSVRGKMRGRIHYDPPITDEYLRLEREIEGA